MLAEIFLLLLIDFKSERKKKQKKKISNLKSNIVKQKKERKNLS